MESNVNKLVEACEDLCNILREMRRKDPNKFFDSPEERLLKGVDSALNSFYRFGITEEREVRYLRNRINELEAELAQHETSSN